MAFREKKGKLDRRIRSRNAMGDAIDIINFILGICVVITAFLVIVNHNKYEKLFPVVFLFAALLNGSMAFKSFKRHELVRMIAGIIAALFLMVMTIISLIALW